MITKKLKIVVEIKNPCYRLKNRLDTAKKRIYELEDCFKEIRMQYRE